MDDWTLFWTMSAWIPLIIIVIIWSLAWKGLALWKAARLEDKAWFVVLIVFNTLGILEILYIYIFSEKNKTASEKNEPVNKKGEKKS